MRKDFQTWWNEHFFETTLPYYRTYRGLNDKGADLDYIRFLHERLEAEDLIYRDLQEQLSYAKKARRREALKEHLSKIPEWIFQGFFEGYLETAKQKNPSDPIFFPTHPRFSERINELNQKALKSVPLILQKATEREKEKSIKRQEQLKSRARRVGIFLEYLPSPEAYKTGGRQDRRGSFFLLAVTEHLHRKRGCYLLVVRLLKAIRGQRFASAYQDRTNAKARVQNLKKIYPRRWKSHLRAERKFYLGLRTSRAS